MRKALGVAENDQAIASDNVKYTLCDASSFLAKAHLSAIRVATSLRIPVVKQLLGSYHRRFKVLEGTAHNAITTVSMVALIKVITGYITDITEAQVNKVAIGTGTNTPAIGNTTLQTESFRKAWASLSFSSNRGYITAFYDKTELSGTFYEHGVFMDGTAAANTGTLLSRVLLNGLTGVAKTTSQTLTVEHEITLTPT